MVDEEVKEAEMLMDLFRYRDLLPYVRLLEDRRFFINGIYNLSKQLGYKLHSGECSKSEAEGLINIYRLVTDITDEEICRASGLTSLEDIKEEDAYKIIIGLTYGI